MTVYTDEEARQRFDAMLRDARSNGEVRIRSSDGQEYIITPAPNGRSPLDVGSVNLPVTAEEIVRSVRDGRERT